MCHFKIKFKIFFLNLIILQILTTNQFDDFKKKIIQQKKIKIKLEQEQEQHVSYQNIKFQYQSRILVRSYNQFHQKTKRLLSYSTVIQRLLKPQNYIKNGNFSDTTCPLVNCLYFYTEYYNQLNYWYPNPQIQVGDGVHYGVNIQGIRVLQLSARQPTCTYQIINNLPEGYYNFIVIYQARVNTSLSNSKFGIYFNDRKSISILPNNDTISNYSDKFYIAKNYSTIKLQFCGQGSIFSNRGTLLLSVRFQRYAYTASNSSSQSNSSYQQDFQNSIINSLDNYSNSNIFSRRVQFIEDYLSVAGLFKIYQFPAIRILFERIFSFLLSLDHLWLYSYHHRRYSTSIIDIYTSVLQLQNNKWNFLSNDFTQNTLNLNITEIRNKIDKKKLYTSFQFLNHQRKSQTFLVNTVEFFIFIVPLIIIVFILGKILFVVFRNYKLGSLFIRFQSNLFILFMLLQGNYESFSYFFTADINTLFFFNKIMKIQGFFLLFIYFIFISIAISGHLIGHLNNKKSQFYIRKNKKSNKYILNNLKRCIYNCSITGIFNITLGIVHYVTYKTSSVQLFYLSSIQIFLIIFLIIITTTKKFCFIKRHILLKSMLFSFLRILFNIHHQIYAQIQDQYSQKQIDHVIKIIANIYTLNCLLLFFIEILFLLCSLVSFLYSYSLKISIQKKNVLNQIIKIQQIKQIKQFQSKLKSKYIQKTININKYHIYVNNDFKNVNSIDQKVNFQKSLQSPQQYIKEKKNIQNQITINSFKYKNKLNIYSINNKNIQNLAQQTNQSTKLKLTKINTKKKE